LIPSKQFAGFTQTEQTAGLCETSISLHEPKMGKSSHNEDVSVDERKHDWMIESEKSLVEFANWLLF
jgi:hypothetical protein